jgi:hypothetical protein
MSWGDWGRQNDTVSITIPENGYSNREDEEMRQWTHLTVLSTLLILAIGADSLSAAEPDEPPVVNFFGISETAFPTDLTAFPWQVQVFGRTVVFFSVNFSEFARSGEWHRLWGLDKPEIATPYRVHGGVI